MRFSDLLRMSSSSLWKRKVRTILTVLGVVIGVASIVVMVSLGLGLNKATMDQIESYGGLTTITVSEGSGSNYSSSTATFSSGSSSAEEAKRLDDALVESLSQIDHVELVAPVLSMQLIAKDGQYENTWMTVYGMTPEGLEKQGFTVGEGHLPMDSEELEFFYGNQVTMDFQNSKTGEGFWGSDEKPPIDLLNDTIFYIFDSDAYYQSKYPSEGQAVKPPKKYLIPAAGIMAGGYDEYNNGCYNVYCNIDALKAKLKQVFKNKAIPGQPTNKNNKPYKELYYNQLYVYVDKIDNVSAIQKMINDMGYEAYSNADWIQQQQQQMGLIQAVLGGIGAVSLLVAAIGIANTMMMSIYERTKEIGIMKVLGCNLGDIRMLFLLEAAFIGLIGGAVGLALSYGISVLLNNVLKLGEVMGGMEGAAISYIPPWLALASLGFAIVVGMLAGFFPSLRAMKLSPLAAIRNE